MSILDKAKEKLALKNAETVLQAAIFHVGEWAEKTFPNATNQGLFYHLGEEYRELYNAIMEDNKENIGEEMADIIILLFHLAHKNNIDLPDHVFKKFEINQSRDWETEANKDDYFNHMEICARFYHEMFAGFKKSQK